MVTFNNESLVQVHAKKVLILEFENIWIHINPIHMGYSFDPFSSATCQWKKFNRYFDGKKIVGLKIVGRNFSRSKF